MKNYTIKENLLITLVNYLATKPYNEVADLIAAVKETVKETPINEPDKE